MTDNLSVLEQEFADLFRRTPTAAEQADLQQLAATSPYTPSDIATASEGLVRTTVGAAEVVVLSYGFFAGATVSAAGLNYLLAPPSGPGSDATSLSSAYYAGFNTENRYINFAVTLAKGGDGAALFGAGYGGLTLQAAADKAYAAIFGSASGEPSDLLTAVVPNGAGGTFTRADYFAAYGGDGANGIGTKAALVGWLLALAAETQSGPYAQAAVGFLQDFAPDETAAFGTSLIGAYGSGGAYATGGRLDPGLPGYTLNITHDQSVLLVQSVGPQPILAEPAAYASQGNDVVTSTTGLDANSGDSFHAVEGVQLGGGNDTLTVTGGFASGLIDAGAGNDRITLSAFNGLIYTGPGYDTVTLASFTSATATGSTGVGSLPAIADFTRGQDQLIFADAVGPGRVSPVDVRGATTLAAALTTVAGETAAGANTVFEWNGDTYVFHQNADPAVNLGAAAGSDGLIQLVGVTGAVLDAHDGRPFDIHFGG